MLNPNTLSWNAPRTNVDGSEITEELDYELGIADGNNGIVAAVTIPQQLQVEDGRYEAPIADMDLGPGEHTVALRAFVKSSPDIKSEWSETVTFRLVGEPGVPFDLQVS